MDSIISAGAIIFILSFSLFNPINAGVYLEGKVVNGLSGLPLDSVRVASVSHKVTALTGTNGEFALEYDSARLCLPETLITAQFDETSVVTTFTGGRRRMISRDEKPKEAAIFNLHGRCIERTALSGASVRFPQRKLPAGMYLLNIDGFPPQRVLVTDRHGSGVIGTRRRTVISVRMPECPAVDTIVFCKEGYASLSLPHTAIGRGLPVTLPAKRNIACDIHNHTMLTDGSCILDTVLAHAFGEGGLDVYVNSEHGGIFSRDTAGLYIPSNSGIPMTQSGIPRWYLLMHYSWPKLLGQRKHYPGKVLLQGIEWNCPGHEHSSVGFIDDADQPEGIAKFEYRFDFNDYDTGMSWLRKSNEYLHDNALTALEWLRIKYPASSYFFINHPSREAIGPYRVEHFRDFHEAAPEIFLGFEGMPGHHKISSRGSYGYVSSDRNRTWGGADHVLAAIGGIWDALLGEGRHLWTIVNSDFHAPEADHWPGEYAKTWVAVTDTGARAWLDGMRSGEIFIAHGDLISGLVFSIDDGIRSVSMGADILTDAPELQLTVKFKSPAVNNHGDSVRVDHIDLISGAITGKIDRFDSIAYQNPVNPTTRVVQRFSARDWSVENGWRVIHTTIGCTRSSYFRLRGTNLAVDTPDETDVNGNPLVDNYGNTEAAAWKDLWFYSNPVFVYKR